ncbi:TPT-domain-containing protein [Choiromyces venosus 120613-1]|uniref:TPT-domain-containing protein n=1 Tax=Choiromyces venosus 120613-1 TaxID=1336337 RepID=A0A3N4JKT6_9PEZI|nr:TPT-domain-containing protein [Choiromyces venosus 120613-1]
MLPMAGTPVLAAPAKLMDRIHPAFYVIVWISLSSAVIIFNKWILDPKTTNFPIFLTTWHLVFSCVATQILARTSTLLDGRKAVKMTGKVYLRAICPIGLFFSLSLICSNKAYLYLSVSFIQMLKATTPVAVLIAAWTLGVESPNLGILKKVTFIVIGVMIASYGEILFDASGFIFQVFGIGFEAVRLVMVQRLLSSAEFKMDPLVSLYYFAPICAAMNFMLFLIFESSSLGVADLLRVGWPTFLLNALVAFGLNVSVVFLIGKTSSLVLTLCGVLKDILLVCASMVIWGNPVTLLQFFGYSIALSGLLYYKLGADKISEQYAHLRGLGFNTRSLSNRRLGIGAASLFTVMVLGTMYHGQYPTRDVASMGTQASYSPSRFIPNNRVSRDRLDIVISMFQENTQTIHDQVVEILSLPQLSNLETKVIVYSMDKTADMVSLLKETGADAAESIPNIGRENGAYLHHILKQWDNLADHTLFIHPDFEDFNDVKARIEDFFLPSTGMLSLGFGHAECLCDECHDPWALADTWSRVPQIFSAVYGEICPSTNILLSYGSRFIVSLKRIKGTERHVYQHLKEVLESDEKHWIHQDERQPGMDDDPQSPYFGHALERSWMIIFKCSEVRLVKSCPKLGTRRKMEDWDDFCQCLDTE